MPCCSCCVNSDLVCACWQIYNTVVSCTVWHTHTESSEQWQCVTSAPNLVKCHAGQAQTSRSLLQEDCRQDVPQRMIKRPQQRRKLVVVLQRASSRAALPQPLLGVMYQSQCKPAVRALLLALLRQGTFHCVAVTVYAPPLLCCWPKPHGWPARLVGWLHVAAAGLLLLQLLQTWP